MKPNIENHVICLLKHTRGQASNYTGTSIGKYEQSVINCCFGKNKSLVK